MLIMTQDGKRLINSEHTSLIFISETPDEVEIFATVEADVSLGTFGNMNHAKKVLRFLAEASVDPEAQDKITCVPTCEELANAESASKKFAQAFCKAKKNDRLDPFSLLSELLNNKS